MIIFAHRGNSSEYIENSISACKSAIDLGCDAIEVDLQEVEGQYWVFHDRFLQRLTDQTGDIYTYENHKLKNVHLRADIIPGQVREKLATLESLIKLVAPHNILLNIELKGRFDIPLLYKNLNALSQSYQFDFDKFLVSAFNHDQLEELRMLDKQIKIGLLRHHQPPSKRQLRLIKPFSQHVELEAICRDIVDSIHHQGQKCFVYTVNYQDQYDYLKSVGVDGVFTDCPRLFLRLRDQE